MNETEAFDALLRTNLYAYTIKAFQVIEPATPFEDNWHIGCISAHLQAQFEGDEALRWLIINEPPRCLKSVHVAQVYPSYCMGHEPFHQFIGASYAHSLAERNVLKTRQIIQSEMYRRLFPETVISSDTNRKDYFTTTQNGQYKGTGIGGTITGFGCKTLIIDDPINPKEAVSDQIRLTAIDEIRSTLFSRFNKYSEGRMVLIMQRLHDADPTGDLLEDGGYYHLKLPAVAPSTIHIDLNDKRWIFEKGDYLTPRLTEDDLSKLRNDLGDYHFCTPSETPITMADLTDKKIEDIVVGDEILGFSDGKYRKSLVPSIVKKIHTKIDDVYEVKLSNGDAVRCTLDHEWYTGRSGNDGHKSYLPVAMNRRLMKVCNPVRFAQTKKEIKDFAWLSGFFDGDGSVNKLCHFTFTQGTGRNIIVCDNLERVLDNLDIKYSRHERVRSDRKNQNGHKIRMYYIKGSYLDNARKMLHTIGVLKWRDRIIKGAYQTRFVIDKPKVTSIQKIAKQKVYGLTTTTGNYIAWGYASKNCGQYLQEPVPLGGGEFKEGWINHYANGSVKPNMMNTYILVDPAGGEDLNKKKKKTSDWTAMMVVGLGNDNNYYLLDIIRDRLNPTERVDTLFILHRKWNALCGKPPKVGYEKYGMMTDTHYIKDKMERDAYHFTLVELGGKMQKEERIRRLIPDMQIGRWYFPHSLIYVDSEGRKFDLVQELIKSEMPTFPRARFDDMLDALSRIYEDDLMTVFPKLQPSAVEKAYNGIEEPDNWENW